MGKAGAKKKRPNVGGPSSESSLIGPDFLQTLRGRVLGKEVSLIVCGENHGDAVNLTRAHGVLEAKQGWCRLVGYAGAGWDPTKAVKSKAGVSLGKAQEWAAEYVKDHDVEEPWFVWEGPSGGKGVARIHDGDKERSLEHPLGQDEVVFEWDDLDAELREFNEVRLSGAEVDIEAHDVMMTRRKEARRREGIELFDDWLERQSAAARLNSNPVDVHLVIEASVSASEFELHRDDAASAPHPAAESIRRLQDDSESDSDDEDDPSDCTFGTDYLDYLQRRLEAALPAGTFHAVDPRDLGDQGRCGVKWDSLLTVEEREKDALEFNPEEAELGQRGLVAPEKQKRRVLRQNDQGERRDAAGQLVSVPEEDDAIQVASGQFRDAVDWTLVDPKECDLAPWGEIQERKTGKLTTLPCFEGFFGQAGDLLYYSMNVKACYVPWLVYVVRSFECWNRFIKTLFFGGTITGALNMLDLSAEARPNFWVRSPVHIHDGVVARRSDESADVAFPYFPLSRFLKARGSEPPRTWLSALFASVECRSEESASLATVVRQHFLDQVEHLALDPKGHDDQSSGGEYFAAWLRETHREVYDDIDRSDPSALLRNTFMPSESGTGKKKADRRHQIGDIKMPTCQAAFAEILRDFKPGEPPTRRSSVLAKILVDVWMLKLVDYAAVLKIVDVVARSAHDRVVVVCYFGAQHATAIVDFWRKHGMTDRGLPCKGMVGKYEYEDDECRKLELPSYLRHVTELFPPPD